MKEKTLENLIWYIFAVVGSLFFIIGTIVTIGVTSRKREKNRNNSSYSRNKII